MRYQVNLASIELGSSQYDLVMDYVKQETTDYYQCEQCKKEDGTAPVIEWTMRDYRERGNPVCECGSDYQLTLEV